MRVQWYISFAWFGEATRCNEVERRLIRSAKLLASSFGLLCLCVCLCVPHCRGFKGLSWLALKHDFEQRHHTQHIGTNKSQRSAAGEGAALDNAKKEQFEISRITGMRSPKRSVRERWGWGRGGRLHGKPVSGNNC